MFRHFRNWLPQIVSGKRFSMLQDNGFFSQSAVFPPCRLWRKRYGTHDVSITPTPQGGRWKETGIISTSCCSSVPRKLQPFKGNTLRCKNQLCSCQKHGKHFKLKHWLRSLARSIRNQIETTKMNPLKLPVNKRFCRKRLSNSTLQNTKCSVITTHDQVCTRRWHWRKWAIIFCVGKTNSTGQEAKDKYLSFVGDRGRPSEEHLKEQHTFKY